MTSRFSRLMNDPCMLSVGRSPSAASCMRQRTPGAARLLVRLMFLMVTLPACLYAQFDYITNNGAITITGYTGSDGVVAIPSTMAGLPVTSIGDWAFIPPVSPTS